MPVDITRLRRRLWDMCSGRVVGDFPEMRWIMISFRVDLEGIESQKRDAEIVTGLNYTLTKNDIGVAIGSFFRGREFEKESNKYSTSF